MRAKLLLVFFCLVLSAHAREWHSTVFHCTANLPDRGGWQTIETPPQTADIETLLMMQHTAKQELFGISVVSKYRDANLADPSVQKGLEGMLQGLKYTFAGHSTVRSGGLDWLQYSVRANTGGQQFGGVIRYASAGGYIFGITMLRGGGQDAAQDSELQQAAASFRILPASAFAAASAPAAGTSGKSTSPSPSATDKTEGETQPADEGSDESRKRLYWLAGGGVVVLLVLFGIIGGGAPKR